MKLINIHEAKTQLSKLLEQVAEGEGVVIAKYGQPVARLVPYAGDKPKYQFGLLKGKLKVSDDFDAPDEALIALYEGKA